jgi:hypothetical protein
MKIKLILLALMGVMLFSSCAKYPQAQVDQVTVAVDSVKTVGGDLYVPEVFKALTDSFTSAKSKVEAEKSKLFKTYKVAKASLVEVNIMAADALVKVETRKAELKDENDALVAEVKALVVIDKELLTKIPKGKDGRAALEAIKTDISSVDAIVAEAEGLISTGDIIGANTKIKVAKDKATDLKNELEEASVKISGK